MNLPRYVEVMGEQEPLLREPDEGIGPVAISVQRAQDGRYFVAVKKPIKEILIESFKSPIKVIEFHGTTITKHQLMVFANGLITMALEEA